MEPKALPPAKINPVKLLGGSSSAITVKKISVKSIAGGDRSVELGIIKKQVIKINDLVKTNTLLKVKEEERKRKLSEQKRFGEKEQKLEEPTGKENKIPSLPALPKLGFLDRIKSFLFNIFLGYISLRLLPYLPKLAGVVDTIVKVQDTVIDISGKILNGLVSFVDKAYEVHDKTRKFLGNLGGENFTKAFDGFIGAMDKVIEASIIAAIAFGELRDIGGGPDTGRPGRGGRPKVTQGRGGQKIRFGAPGTGPKVTGGKPRLPTRGAITKGGLLALVNLIPDILNSWDLWQNQGRGKDALRTFFSAVAGAAAGLGALTAVEAGATALGITGVGIPAAIALAVSGFAASSLAGTGAYNLTDAILKRMGLVDNDPDTGKPYAYRTGGTVTRGGKLSGPARRTVEKPKAKRTLKVQTTEVKPGQSVGGKKVIEKVFPEVETKEKGKTVNPLGYMKSSYKIGSSIPGFGGLDAIFMKARLGEKASGADYQRAADGLSAWMQRVYGGGRIGAFAEGGNVDVSMFNDDIGMKNMLAKALQDTVAPKVDEMINDLKKQLGLKETQGKKDQEEKGAPSGAGEYSPEGIQGDIYQYLLSKGMDDVHALGIMANISRESGFRPGVSETGGPGVGLFQYSSGGRKTAFLKAVPDYATNWKKQIDYALTESGEPGQRYLIMKFNSPQEAADWWMRNWERPAEYIQSTEGPRIHREYLASLEKFKTKKGYELPTSADLAIGGKGYGAQGVKIAGDLGRYIYQVLKTPQQFQAVTEHPDFGGISGKHASPGYKGYHKSGRAIDIGAFAYEQGPILKAVADFNRMRGVKPVELFYAGHDPTGEHSNHVHVAYAKGGKVRGFTRAILGERGPEFVIDADSTKALEDNFPGFLDALNKANYDGAIKVLRSYAEYEQGSTIQAVVDEKLIPVPIPVPSPQQPPVIISSGLGEIDDSMSFNYTR